MSTLYLLIAFVVLAVKGEEISCGRKFEYEYDVLRKIHNLEETVSQQDTLIKYLMSRQTDTESRLDDLHASPRVASSYVRWGRTTCPSGSDLLYDGFASGSAAQHTGAGSNVLCLPNDPTWDKYSDGMGEGTRIWVAQYHFNKDLFAHLNKFTVPCGVCQVNRTGVMMLPGKTECPENYTNEYHGYLLTSAHITSQSSADYICMDGHPEAGCNATGQNGALLSIVQGECGALKCPPYVEGREITCSVCSYSL